MQPPLYGFTHEALRHTCYTNHATGAISIVIVLLCQIYLQNPICIPPFVNLLCWLVVVSIIIYASKQGYMK